MQSKQGTGLQKKSVLPTVRIGFCLCSVMFVHAWPDKGGSEKVSLSTAYKLTLTYIICNLFYSVFACNSEQNLFYSILHKDACLSNCHILQLFLLVYACIDCTRTTCTCLMVLKFKSSERNVNILVLKKDILL